MARRNLIERGEVVDMLVQRAAEFRRELMDRGRRLSLRLFDKTSQQIVEILHDDAIEILRKYSR